MPTNTTLKVQKWGNSLAVRIPSSVARAAKLLCGQEVVLEVVDGDVLVRVSDKPPALSLAQKLKAFDPALHGGELMADEARGVEFPSGQ